MGTSHEFFVSAYGRTIHHDMNLRMNIISGIDNWIELDTFSRLEIVKRGGITDHQSPTRSSEVSDQYLRTYGAKIFKKDHCIFGVIFEDSLSWKLAVILNLASRIILGNVHL